MKKLLLILLVLNFISCQEITEPSENIFFDSQKLPLLSLDKVDSFWINDSIKRVLNFSEDALFNSHQAYLGGNRYEGERGYISVTVFNSQKTSVEAMELRCNNVASIIREGINNDLIDGKWWYMQGISNVMLLNKFNTIIEVSYNYYPAYSENETVLIQTVLEIAQRIDSLSSVK